MKVIYGSHLFKGFLKRDFGNPVMTLGVFDGLHKGHQKLIQRVVCLARELKTSSLLYTVDPHPMELLNQKVKRLFPLEQIIEKASEWNLDFFVVEKFSKDFSKISSLNFVEKYLYERIRPQKIIIGEDFRFGLNREGHVLDLVQWGKKFGFEVEVIPSVQMHGENISSTRIRKAYRQSQFQQLYDLLGRPFSVKGEVIKGKGIGTRLGFPTANIKLDSSMEYPKKGVYICRLKCHSKTYFGVMNWGVAPTISDSNIFLMEVHLLNSPELVLKGEKVEVEILSYLRSERKFDSSEQLIQAIRLDIQKAEEYFSNKEQNF